MQKNGRLNLRVSKRLLQKAKDLARRKEMSLSQLIVQLLHEALLHEAVLIDVANRKVEDAEQM